MFTFTTDYCYMFRPYILAIFAVRTEHRTVRSSLNRRKHDIATDVWIENLTFSTLNSCKLLISALYTVLYYITLYFIMLRYGSLRYVMLHMNMYTDCQLQSNLYNSKLKGPTKKKKKKRIELSKNSNYQSYAVSM